MPPTIHSEFSVAAQADRLIELGVPELAGITAEKVRALAGELTAAARSATALTATALTTTALSASAPAAEPGHGQPLLAIHPDLVPTAQLATLMRRQGKAGFVVVDMTDLADFIPTDDVTVPDAPLYLVEDVIRGDDMVGWTPTEAHAELNGRGRTPLTISEGVSWLLQDPKQLEPGRCFMCIGSRKRKATGGLDSRTPALWISGGTGRDGRENNGAPKVGWCWAGNHHTWLGFASTASRQGPEGRQGPSD